MNDTSPEIAEMIRQRYLAMSPAERLVIGARMFESARAMVVASLPSGLSAEETRRRICERFYGELAEEVFGESEHRVSVVQEQTNCFDEVGSGSAQRRWGSLERGQRNSNYSRPDQMEDELK